MAQQTRTFLKNLFLTGLRPIQNNYWDWLDSFFHKDDTIAISNVTGLNAALTGLATTAQIDAVQAQISSGTWTITTSSLVRTTISTAVGYYTRIGNYVSFTVRFNVTITASGGSTFNFDLPIPSDFANAADLTAVGSGLFFLSQVTGNGSLNLAGVILSGSPATDNLTISGHYIIR